MQRSKLLNRLTLSDLECSDGAYNVGHLVTLAHPWVSKGEAEEILEIKNALIDALLEYINETID
jgi:hypothetical protein